METANIADPANIVERDDTGWASTSRPASWSTSKYLAIYDQYAPLWDALTPEAAENVKKKNYERLFDAARSKVRAWERANVP